MARSRGRVVVGSTTVRTVRTRLDDARNQLGFASWLEMAEYYGIDLSTLHKLRAGKFAPVHILIIETLLLASPPARQEIAPDSASTGG